jgi:hypothetical protein
MDEKLLYALRALSALGHLKRSGLFDGLKGLISDLQSQLTLDLPDKADGTPWTDAEIHEAAEAARHTFQQTLDRTASAQGDGSGD